MITKLIGGLEHLLAFFSKSLTRFKEMDSYSRLAVLTVAALFLPFFLGGVFAAVASIYLLWKPEMRRRILSVRCAGFLYAMAAISLMVSLYYQNWIGIGCALAMFLLFTYTLFLRVIMTPSLYHCLLKLVCILSVLSAIYAVVQMVNVLPLDQEYRTYATFLNPNLYGTITEFVIIICVYQMCQPGCGRRENWFYLTIIGFNLVGLMTSGCRSAWGGLVAALLVILILQRKPKILLLFVVLGAVALLMLWLYPSLFPRFAHMEGSALNRMNIWKGGLAIFPDSPWFGKGSNTYYYEFLRQTKDQMVATIHAHNVFINCLIDYGIVGCTLLLTYLVSMAVRVVKGLRRKVQDKSWILMLGILASICGHGIADVTILAVEVSLMAAMLFSATGIYDKAQLTPSLERPCE